MAGRFDRVGGVWDKVSKRYDKVGGIWQPVKKRFDKAGGIWKPSFSSGVSPTNINTEIAPVSDSASYWTAPTFTALADNSGLNVNLTWSHTGHGTSSSSEEAIYCNYNVYIDVTLPSTIDCSSSAGWSRCINLLSQFLNVQVTNMYDHYLAICALNGSSFSQLSKVEDVSNFLTTGYKCDKSLSYSISTSSIRISCRFKAKVSGRSQDGSGSASFSIPNDAIQLFPELFDDLKLQF